MGYARGLGGLCQNLPQQQEQEHCRDAQRGRQHPASPPASTGRLPLDVELGRVPGAREEHRSQSGEVVVRRLQVPPSALTRRMRTAQQKLSLYIVKYVIARCTDQSFEKQ